MDELQNNSGKASLEVIVETGAVYLPEKARLSTRDPIFDNVLWEYLPQDISEQAIKLTTKPRYSAVQILMIAAIIAALLSLLYVLFPKPVELTRMPYYLSIVPPKTNFTTHTDYMFVRNKAVNLYRTRQFDSCADTLANTIHSLRTGKLISASPELAFLYADSAYKGNDSEHKRSGYELARQMNLLFPDELCWQLFMIELSPPLRLAGDNCSAFDYRKAWNILAKVKSGRAVKAMIDPSIWNLRNIERQIAAAANTARHKEDPGSVFALEVRLAQLMTTQWVLEGCELEYPDDNPGEPGVAARESAYAMAQKHPASTDMLQIRKFIVENLINTVGGYYHWNGARYYRTKYLTDEKAAIEQLLKNNQK